MFRWFGWVTACTGLTHNCAKQTIFLLLVYIIGRCLFNEKNLRSDIFWWLTTGLSIVTIARWFK